MKQKNTIDAKAPLLNDAKLFHAPKWIQYIMLKIRTKEHLIRYMMLFVKLWNLEKHLFVKQWGDTISKRDCHCE
jgi:hypothetical protein